MYYQCKLLHTCALGNGTFCWSLHVLQKCSEQFFSPIQFKTKCYLSDYDFKYYNFIIVNQESTGDEESGSSSEEESEEPPAKTETPGKYKPPKRPHALCGICLKGPESNKKNCHEAYNSWKRLS